MSNHDQRPMPRRSATASLPDRNPAPGGAAAVDRALALLAVFTPQRAKLSLADLAASTGLYKSTVLRLLASLEHARLIERQVDGLYRLGPEVARLNHVYASAFSLEAVVMPALAALVGMTGESAAFYVRQGTQRLCLYRVNSPKPVRDHINVGDLLPLDRGASGRVLLAFAGARGALYERIRSTQVAALVGDRVPELAGIAAAVFGASGELLGAITLTMPAERFEAGYAAAVRDTAQALTAALGGTVPGPER